MSRHAAGDELDPRVRPAPPGLTRRERRAWREDEAVRLVELAAATQPADGLRSMMVAKPPRRLGRAGRQLWRKAENERRGEVLAEEESRSASDRYAGALVLLVVLAVVVGCRMLVDGPALDGAPPAPATPLVTYQPTAPTTAPALGAGAAAAVLAWWTLVCPSTPDDPQSARLARSAGLMTPAAWSEIDHSATPVGSTWSCTNLSATLGPSSTGEAVVTYSATVATGQGSGVVEARRLAERQAAGTWLVGALATAG